MLNMTKVELEMIPDPKMYIFFEKGTKSRVFYISNRCSIANSNYLKYYDKKKNQNILYT